MSTPLKPTLNMSDTVNPSQWLNFSLPPRPRPTGPQGVPRRSRKAEGWRAGIMSRERYVQANFRFVLKPTETLSYGAHFADPDIPLHWPNILQVLVPTFSAFSVAQGFVSEDADDLSVDEDELDAMPEEAAERRRRVEEERRGRMCPICLGKPVSGRMTKCGHIFCFPCILHYIQLSDIPKSAKCPICGDTVHEGMLKSVKYLDAKAIMQDARAEHESEHELVVGHLDGLEDASESRSNRPEQISMRLIQRPQMTTLALPASTTWPSDAIPPHTAPWYFLPDVLSHSRFMLASPDYMLSELNRELDELKSEWDLLRGDDLGRDFVRAAKAKVERQIGKVRDELMTDAVHRSELSSREAWSCETSEPSRPDEGTRKSRRRQAAPVAPEPGSSYYFYQSTLGANVFLHPLDIRILLSHFKSYSLFPRSLSFKSSGFDPGTVNEDLRKRCKYLGHLPAGTEVIFVEAELEDIVGKEGLAAFEQPLRTRREKRRARVRKEDRAKTRWEQQERAKVPRGVSRDEQALAEALTASETLWTDFGSSLGAGSSRLGPSPGTSPTWGDAGRTFASTLSSAAIPKKRVERGERREAQEDVNAVWDAFNSITIRESEKGGGEAPTHGGRKGGKKGAKKTLVLGGGGRGAR
ncbi:hypothetical protein BD324DRAFT_636206 [Kockovaella imperatae]|uniref:RING-type domain-containing protein n=1 Tax=Kockovaella imperatae TaxID=4999 RepID=A0A1Y1UBQ8_9TREE|nr:hypothetical protein BD324DRAFT_636206 [Kockovaella imperatae]ORX34515.1 hypothetical protein BD324DRAFT_636206 [Kockovaella imperatae]